jgi:Dolichyl-phosphate-mannose-protein mannosyltransferase
MATRRDTQSVSTIESQAPSTLGDSIALRLAALRRGLLHVGMLALPGAVLVAALAAGTALRVWELGTLGFNSDEAVYAGQAAAIAADPELSQIFPIFRAHPLLFQYVLALGHLAGLEEVAARGMAVVVGMLTVGLTFMLGRLLYGTWAGLLAALFMSLMPYHVLVSRQVLLDGPMVFCATLVLYLVARFAASSHPPWLWAAGAALGLTFLAKETGIVLLGAVYAFLALSPEVRVRLRDLAMSIAAMALVIAPFPLSLQLAGGDGATKAGSYLVWQLFRRANHDWAFYPSVVSVAMGIGLVATLAVGLVLMRRYFGWQERLLLAWIVIPVAFFQLWPVKGFQYLLPISIPVATLAAFTVTDVLPLTLWSRVASRRVRTVLLPLLLATLIGGSLGLHSWFRVQVAISGEFLAGSGGVPGGREAGTWIRDHVPEGATLMTIGPSMANILMYYGQRQAYGLSVSPNPLQRNPSYEPIENPDFAIRSGDIQYIVWDSFSAARSEHFSLRLMEYVRRFNGRVAHTETITTTAPSGEVAEVPVIIVFEVRP